MGKLLRNISEHFMSDRATPSRQSSPQQSPATPTALEPGDRIPDFCGATHRTTPSPLRISQGNLLVLASFARMPEKPDDLEVLKL
ncbi:MAG: hypothetical protein HC925_08700, partial [Coleofasciculaceae cyanobacterium SM2_3_26]|nr:hypothetical protein [Coleofasciculaceae cyanobacterium SM2_3_26]